MSDKREIIVGFVASIVIFFVMFGSALYVIGDPLLKASVTFSLVAYEIAQEYQTPTSNGSMMRNAERAVFSLLDPFSYRIEHSDYNYLLEEASGEYGGIGIAIMTRDTLLLVASVREGGPAYEGGMKVGDYIITVDSEAVPRHEPASAIALIRGRSGSKVDITVYRPEIEDSLLLPMVRGNITLEHVPYYGLTEDGFGYIRLVDFEAGAADELKQALADLESQSVAGYILDLKGNPGGYFDEAIDAADLFLPDGELVVGTAGRSRWEDRRFYSSHDPITDKPVVVLTDRGTASAAEILSGAMRGANRAIVLGDTTFGKGLVQSVYSLSNNDAIRLTTSRYYFSDGRFLNPPDSELAFSGLAPDLFFREEGEYSFQSLVLSGFLMYDFVEEYQSLLESYPEQFGYPDKVIELFSDFALSRDVGYNSYLTGFISLIEQDQKLGGASNEVIAQLGKILDISSKLDQNVFERHKTFLKYHLRRMEIDRRLGRKEAYRRVIVPGRPDIIRAGDILNDPQLYNEILSGQTVVSSQASPIEQTNR